MMGLIDWIRTQLAENPIFGGVMGASMMAGAWMAIKTWGCRIVDLIWDQCCVRLTVRSQDEVFSRCQEWFDATPYMKRRCRRLQASTKFDDSEDGKNLVSPALGNHWLFFNRRLFRINRSEDESTGSTHELRERFTITCFGRSRAALLQFLDEVTKGKADDTIVIYTWTSGWWNRQRRRAGRQLSTLFLNDGIAESIVEDVERFFSSKELYEECGIPYHRNYMFSGPPGTGKTSLAVALATKFNLGIRYMSLNSFNDDKELLDAVTRCLPRSLILIEDVDAARSSKTRALEKDGEEKKGITTSGLLNALDGVVYPEGSIYVLTTNHAERLDPAMTRNGRVDVSFELDYPSVDTVCRMAEAFYGSLFVKHLVSNVTPQSQAAWQSLFAKTPRRKIRSTLARMIPEPLT